MKSYIGTKCIQAEPAWRWNGKIYLKSEGTPKAMGIEDGYKVVYPDGYESWSPKDVFEAAYREVDGLTFGIALEMAKRGCKIARHGWNGPDQWVIIRTGYMDAIPCNQNTAEAMGIPEGTPVKIRPYMQLRCVDGSFQMWTPSVSDTLAEDWYIVEESKK